MMHRILMATLAISLFHFPCGYADTAEPQQKTGPEASCGGANPEALTIQSFEQLMVDLASGPSRAGRTPGVTLHQLVMLNGHSSREQFPKDRDLPTLSFSQRLPKGAVVDAMQDQRVALQANDAGKRINLSFPMVRETAKETAVPSESRYLTSGAASLKTESDHQHTCGGGCCGKASETKKAVRSTGGGCGLPGQGGGSGCGCGGGAQTSNGQRTPDPTRIVYQARLPKEYAPDRWAKVSVEASPNRLLLNQKNLVTLTAYLKVREGQAQGCTFFIPKLDGADMTIRLATPGVTVREVPQGAIYPYASAEPQQKVQLLMEVVPHHASSLDLSRVFMCWIALPEPLFPLQANDANAPAIQSRSMVTYTSSLLIPITQGGRK